MIEEGLQTYFFHMHNLHKNDLLVIEGRGLDGSLNNDTAVYSCHTLPLMAEHFLSRETSLSFLGSNILETEKRDTTSHFHFLKYESIQTSLDDESEHLKDTYKLILKLLSNKGTNALASFFSFSKIFFILLILLLIK
jgi:hypothetical protein